MLTLKQGFSFLLFYLKEGNTHNLRESDPASNSLLPKWSKETCWGEVKAGRPALHLYPPSPQCVSQSIPGATLGSCLEAGQPGLWKGRCPLLHTLWNACRIFHKLYKHSVWMDFKSFASKWTHVLILFCRNLKNYLHLLQHMTGLIIMTTTICSAVL